MMLRAILVLVVALLASGGLAACSSSPDTGDCIERSGDSYETANCATASLRVLERLKYSSYRDGIDVAR